MTGCSSQRRYRSLAVVLYSDVNSWFVVCGFVFACALFVMLFASSVGIGAVKVSGRKNFCISISVWQVCSQVCSSSLFLFSRIRFSYCSLLCAARLGCCFSCTPSWFASCSNVLFLAVMCLLLCAILAVSTKLLTVWVYERKFFGLCQVGSWSNGHFVYGCCDCI